MLLRSASSLTAPVETSSVPAPDAAHPVAFRKPEALSGAYRWLLAFMVIYCARPEDWIPGLYLLHLAKVAGFLALVAFILSVDQVRGGLFGLPREMLLMLLLLGQLSVSAIASPIWRGGAVHHVLDFAKVVLIALVVVVSVTSLGRLRRLVFVETASVTMIVLATILKGRLNAGRLEGILNGMYQNPNDFAFAIALGLPFALAFLVAGRGIWRKLFWLSVMAMMVYAVLLTASRSGLLATVMAAGVAVWEFGIKGRRRYLPVLASMVMIAAVALEGGLLKERFLGTFNVADNVAYSWGSAEQRRQLLKRSLEVTAEHPLLGVGAGNFDVVSGAWRVTHNAYTQMSSEAGIPALILFLMILWKAFSNLRKVKELAPGHEELILFAGALRASLAGFLVGAFFESVAYLFFPYILVVCTTALVTIARANELAAGSEDAAGGLPGSYAAACKAMGWSR